MIVDKLEVKIGADTSEFEKASLKTRENLKDVVSFSEKAMTSIQKNLGDALGDFLIKGEFNFDKVIGGLKRTVGQQILSGGANNGGATGGLTSVFERIFSGIIGGARAQGGMVSTGVPYLVGERGAEVFVPSSSGYISPNGGAGRSMNVNMTVVTADANSFKASQGQIMAEVATNLRRASRNL